MTEAAEPAPPRSPNERNSMTDDSISPVSARRNAARARAENQFTPAQRGGADIHKEIADQRAATAVQTAKLRALRLAKEEADRATAAPKPASKPHKIKTIKIS